MKAYADDLAIGMRRQVSLLTAKTLSCQNPSDYLAWNRNNQMYPWLEVLRSLADFTLLVHGVGLDGQSIQ